VTFWGASFPRAGPAISSGGLAVVVIAAGIFLDIFNGFMLLLDLFGGKRD
jgi:hypothetical protein